MLRQAVHQWFWDYYDQIGKMMLANVVAFFILFSLSYLMLISTIAFVQGSSPGAQILVLFFMCIIFLPILFSVWFSSFLYFGEKSSKEMEPRLADLIVGIRKHFLSLMPVVYLLNGIVFVLLLNIWFYTASGVLDPSLKYVGYGLAGVCFWLIFFLIAIAMLALPLRVRETRPIKSCIALSVRTIFKYPGLMIGGTLFLISLWIIGSAIRMTGIILFAFAGSALFMNSIYDVFVELENESASADLTPEEIEARIKPRYRRTFQDILKPWSA